MTKLEFLDNKDSAPDYVKKIYPVGTKLRWVQEDRPILVRIVVVGYGGCADSQCDDCDKKSYIDERGTNRCHFRRSDSSFGQCYWEIDNV